MPSKPAGGPSGAGVRRLEGCRRPCYQRCCHPRAATGPSNPELLGLPQAGPGLLSPENANFLNYAGPHPSCARRPDPPLHFSLPPVHAGKSQAATTPTPEQPAPLPRARGSHLRTRRCSCSSWLDKECVYFCHLDIIWVNTPG